MEEEDVHLSPEIQRLTEKLARDPKSRLFAQLADAYRKCGMFEEAVQVCKQGLEHHPRYASAHIVLGRCYYGKGMLALAKEHLGTALEIDPRNLVALALLGDINLSQGLRDEAIGLYQRVIELDPLSEAVMEKLEQLTGEPSLSADMSHRAEAAHVEVQPRMRPAAPQPPPIEPSPVPPDETEETPKLEEPVLTSAEAEPAPWVEIPTIEVTPEAPRAEEPIVGGPPEPQLLADVEVATEPGSTLDARGPEDAPTSEPPIALGPGLATEPGLMAEATGVPDAPIAAEPEAGVVQDEPPVPEPEVGIELETPPSEPTAERLFAAEPKAREGREPLATLTLAEIYAQQGFIEKALEIYRQLHAAEPENEGYGRKVKELAARLPQKSPETGAVPDSTEETPPPLVDPETMTAAAVEPEPTLPEALKGERSPSGIQGLDSTEFTSMLRELRGETPEDAGPAVETAAQAPFFEREPAGGDVAAGAASFETELPAGPEERESTEVTPLVETPPESVVTPASEEGEIETIPSGPGEVTLDMEPPPGVSEPAEPGIAPEVPPESVVTPEIEVEAARPPVEGGPQTPPETAVEPAPAEETIAFTDLFTQEEKERLGLGAEGSGAPEPARSTDMPVPGEPDATPAVEPRIPLEEPSAFLKPGRHEEDEADGPEPAARPGQEAAPSRRPARDEDMKRFQDWLNGLTK